MECAGKGRGSRCLGPPTKSCTRCGAVAYCSVSHQISHRSEHKEECERFQQQMKRVDAVNDFPFTFSKEVREKQESRCSFLTKIGIHRLGMWAHECPCGASLTSFDRLRTNTEDWHLPGSLCPCQGPISPLSKYLTSWMQYYEWRCIPFYSPAALLLHWPLMIYHATQIAIPESLKSITCNQLRIHYLGPEKELSQIAAFGELSALFPGKQVHLEFIGPAIPECRDGEMIDLQSYARCLDTDCLCGSSSESAVNGKSSSVTLKLHKGLYHDRFRDLDSLPHLVIAPNAGIAAYPSWKPTIELVKNASVPAIFSDYCEEACHLAAQCVTSVIGSPVTVPIQLNPFRQPMVVEENSLFLPCYSNCFLFGM